MLTRNAKARARFVNGVRRLGGETPAGPVHSDPTFSRIAFLAIFARSALCFASAASALPVDPGDGDPNLPPPKPNLVIGNASITAGTLVNDWAISYTVTNRGNAPAGAFRVAVQQDGTALLKDSY
jgi:hypothetical protein